MKIKYLTFNLKKEIYAISITDVQEIINTYEIIKIPEVPHFIEGIINLRNKVIPIIDLKKRFSISEKENEKRIIIIVKIVNYLIGLMVDKVNEVIEISEEEIDIPSIIKTRKENTYIKGMAKLNDKLYIILEIKKLFTEQEIKNINEISKGGANEESNKITKSEKIQYVTFNLKSDRYGIKIKEVQEIIKVIPYTTVPNMPDFIEGIIELREQIIPLIDLNKRFKIKKEGNIEQLNNKDNRIIIINIKENLIGFIVDSVSEVLNVEKEMIKKMPELEENKAQEFIEGVVKQDGKLVLLLDTKKIIKRK